MKLRRSLFGLFILLFVYSFIRLFVYSVPPAFASCRVESSCSAGGVQADFTLSKPEAASACPGEAEAGDYSICCYDDTKEEQDRYSRYFSARELARSQDALKAAVCGTATETIPACASCFNGGLLVCYGRDRATGETDPELQCRPGEDYCGVEIKDENGDGQFMYNGKPYGVQAVSVCGSNNFACTQPDCVPLFDYPQPGSSGKPGSGVKPTDSYDADTLCYERELINEPHPLRPAPGLVCSKEVPSPWNLSCANDVLPTLTVELPRTKDGAYNCSDAGDIGREQCTREIKEYQPPDVTVTIDLGNLELPIAGVASNTRVSDTLSFAQKMLNYTSWYLQGTLGQASQEPLDSAASPPANQPVQPPAAGGGSSILALGDSITAGTAGPSYLCALKQLNPQLQFVGPETLSACGVEHAGYGRATAGAVLNAKSDWLPLASWANIALIHLGTNDVNSFPADQIDRVTIPNLKEIIRLLKTQNPMITIILAKIIPSRDNDMNFFNQKIAALAGDAGVATIDAGNGFDPAVHLADPVHPNQAGAKIIAANFAAALAGAAQPAPAGGGAAQLSGIDRLIAYSGPVKKLIPQEVLNEKRKQLVFEAVNKKTYNQIIGYVKNNQVIGRLEAKKNLNGVAIVRLTDMKGHIAPKWDDHDPEKQKWYTLWQQVSFTGKEDPGRNPNTSGHVDVPGEVFPTACVRSETNLDGCAGGKPCRCKSDETVIDARFKVSSGVESFRVNFPHLVEDDTLLMTMLQDALISRDVARTVHRPNYPLLAQNLDEPTRLPEWTKNSQGNYPNADGCVQETTAWNPGDNLEARKNKTGGRITGLLNFKKDIEYSFKVETAASIKYIENCQNSGRSDCPAILPATVPVEITAPVPVHIRYSHMDEIGDRAVVGPGGIFKALYPEIPTTIGELINKPAESAIGYSCSVPGGRCQADSTSHKGQPRVFFPWWGTLLDLFHTKIQEMLDPLRAVRTPIGGIGQEFSSSSPYASSDIQAALAAAALRHNVPQGLLQAIFEIEGTEFIASGICVESNKGAVGPMQVIDADGSAYWDAVSEAERQTMNLCNPGDAAEAAARIIVFKVGTGSVTDADWIKRAAKGYYGSCEPDSVTEGRWGDGIGYCDFVLYRMNLCPALEASCDGE